MNTTVDYCLERFKTAFEALPDDAKREHAQRVLDELDPPREKESS